MDEIGDKVDSKFRFVLLAAERAEQIIRGAAPRVESAGPKIARTAMEEIRRDLVEWDYGPAPEPEAQEPDEGEEGEVEAAAESDVH